jgi:hypothetical protein
MTLRRAEFRSSSIARRAPRALSAFRLPLP